MYRIGPSRLHAFSGYARRMDGFATQLNDWRSALGGGARRVGWKIGFNAPAVQQRFGISEPVLGHLTSRTLIESGGAYDATGAGKLLAEAEVALEIGDGGAIAGYAPAIELVDMGTVPDDIDEIVAGNIFHRAVVLGPFRAERPSGDEQATVSVSGEVRETPAVAGEFEAMVDVARRHLEAAGEALEPGDVLISGALCVLPVSAGDHLVVDLGSLGAVELRID